MRPFHPNWFLLYSHKIIDVAVLQEALADLTDFPVGLRWKMGEGKKYDDGEDAPHYAAYHVECSLKGHDIVRDRMGMIFPTDTSPRRHVYPLGLRLIFVPKEQGMSSLADAKELITIWLQQDWFAKNLAQYTTTHMIYSLDEDLDEHGSTIRDIIMSIPAPRSPNDNAVYPLFHSVRLYQREGATWITQFSFNIMHHWNRTKHVANNLLTFLCHVCDVDILPSVEQFFAPWAIAKADEATFDKEKGTVTSATSQALKSIVSGNADPHIDMIVNAASNSDKYARAMKKVDPSETAADLLRRCREAQHVDTPAKTSKKRKDDEKQAKGTPSRGMHTRKKTPAGWGQEAGGQNDAFQPPERGVRSDKG